MRRRAPGWPLVATLGAHLLLAWWWIDATGVRLLPSFVPALREFVVVPVLVPPLAAPVPPVPSPTTRNLPSAAPRVPARAPIEAPSITDAESGEPVPEAQPDPLAAPSAVDAVPVEEHSVAGRAKREAGRVDNALRQGKLAPLTPTDTPWKRFVAGVEGARRDTSMTLTSESYTSPDGTIIYRFRKNGRYYCRTGGAVRPNMFGAEGGKAELFDRAGGGGFAGLVACPGQAEFKRD